MRFPLGYQSYNTNNYLKYLDGCFFIAKDEQELVNFYKLFNKLCSLIKFTIATEHNNELFYFDVLIKRKNTKLVTSVFRKKNITGSYLNFQSHCGLKQKVNLIRTLSNRAHLIYSPDFFEEELNNIKTLLYRNLYSLI